jgi:hypothetical protein
MQPEAATKEVDVGPSAELVVYEPPPAPNLFSPDPEQALKRMAELATPLADVIEAKKLYATISGRRHITAEGWTTLGGMLGVVPVVCWTRPNETGDGYVARVEARTLDGRVVGAAESSAPAWSRNGRTGTHTRSARWRKPARSAEHYGRRWGRSSCSPATRPPAPRSSRVSPRGRRRVRSGRARLTR